MRRSLFFTSLAGMWLVATAGWLFRVDPAARNHSAAASDPLPLGFSRFAAEAELAAERRLAAEISTNSISEFHRRLTERPHIAGTAAGRAVAEEIGQQLRAAGLETEMRGYDAYLSHPIRVRLTLLKPIRRSLPVYERSDPRDPSSGRRDLTPGFIAYSASGRVRGPVIYVNYGLPADYQALEAAGINVRGTLVLARYGKVHRAVKVFNAEQRGARGILIYSDPADDGYAQGEVWPAGPWRESWFLQRGNAKYSWFWHGDPLTPFVPARKDAARHKPEEVPTLPKIPAVAISWSAARQILSELRGAAVPAGFQGGLPFTYHAGPGPAEVELDVQMDSRLKQIVNVLGRISGKEEADRWVILGTHHDAWTFGGVDPGSSAGVILELARVLGTMQKAGWQPRRSIVFAFWDAEEYGLIGSTEYAEEFAEELREKGVAYVNSDLYLAGQLEAGGTAALRDLVAEVARAVNHPGGDGSVYSAWQQTAWRKLPGAEKRRRAGQFEVDLEPLGSGADFVPFQAYLGLPTLSLEFGIERSYGSYHSRYDSRYYMEKLGDPGWRYGRALTELLGRTVMRLASAEVLPYRFSHTAEKLEEYLTQLETQNADSEGRPYLAGLELRTTRERLAVFSKQARELERATVLALARGPIDGEAARKLNDRLARAEKSFIVADDTASPATRRWYRHTVYGWNIYALYSGQTLPALDRALTARDAAAFAAERARLEAALERSTAELAGAAALLP